MKKNILLLVGVLLLLIMTACNSEKDVEEESKEEEQEVIDVVEELEDSDGEVYHQTTSVIKEIKEEENLTIKVEGESGDLIVQVEENTYINEEVVLEEGEIVEIQHTVVNSQDETPIVTAISINPKFEIETISSKVEIKEVIKNEEDSVTSLLVDRNGEEVIFHFDYTTEVEEGLNFTEGLEVKIEHTDIFALSYPAQGHAISITSIK